MTHTEEERARVVTNLVVAAVATVALLADHVAAALGFHVFFLADAHIRFYLASVVEVVAWRQFYKLARRDRGALRFVAASGVIYLLASVQTWWGKATVLAGPRPLFSLCAVIAIVGMVRTLVAVRRTESA